MIIRRRLGLGKGDGDHLNGIPIAATCNLDGGFVDSRRLAVEREANIFKYGSTGTTG